METLHFLKFWKPNTSFVPSPVVEADNEVDDEEDSFFELELTVPDYDSKENNTTSKNNDYPDEKTTESTKDTVFNGERANCRDKMAGDGEPFCPKPELVPSPADPISKRKILPVEPISKPQSPIALLKSAPRFRGFMFKNPKSTATQKTEKTGEADSYKLFMGTTQKQQKQEGKLFTMKFNVEDAQKNLSHLNRESSMRNNESKTQNQSSDESKAERKDVLQKYLKLIKPLYVKASKRYSEKMRFPSDLSLASPASSPVPAICSPKEKQGNIPAGIRNVCKHLGKSKSASATALVMKRRDDSLLQQQHDGIQSAILHCKRSFNSSRGTKQGKIPICLIFWEIQRW